MMQSDKLLQLPAWPHQSYFALQGHGVPSTDPSTTCFPTPADTEKEKMQQVLRDAVKQRDKELERTIVVYPFPQGMDAQQLYHLLPDAPRIVRYRLFLPKPKSETPSESPRNRLKPDLPEMVIEFVTKMDAQASIRHLRYVLPCHPGVSLEVHWARDYIRGHENFDAKFRNERFKRARMDKSRLHYHGDRICHNKCLLASDDD